VLTNLLVSFLLALSNGWRYLFLLPPAFLTLHLAYGLGFAKGIFQFGKYWFNFKP
jgi:hypothetical protein